MDACVIWDHEVVGSRPAIPIAKAPWPWRPRIIPGSSNGRAVLSQALLAIPSFARDGRMAATRAGEACTMVNRKVVSSSLTSGASINNIAEWTGEAPAGPHKACYAGSNPVSATLGG